MLMLVAVQDNAIQSKYKSDTAVLLASYDPATGGITTIVLAITGKNRLMGGQGLLGHKRDIPAQAALASCSGRDEATIMLFSSFGQSPQP